MSTSRRTYLGPVAVGYLPKTAANEFEDQLNQRLWSPLQDDATHHWVPKVSCSSPILTALARYNDGSQGSFVVETSSEKEIEMFKADFQSELEVLKAHYEKLEVILGIVSY